MLFTQKSRHSPIRAYLNTSGEEVVLEMQDNGIGMSEDQIQKCMDPFYTTKDVGQGTGLGLSIVYGLLNEFNAKLKIISAVNVGTTMQVLLKTKE